MDRKGFLQRIFGAAALAVIPKPVIDQIEKLPPPPPPEKDVIEVVKEQIGDRQYKPFAVDFYGDRVLFIYLGEVLLGFSTDFNLDIHNTFESIPTKRKEWTGEYRITKKGKKKKKYRYVEDWIGYPLPKSWRIQAESINWQDGILECNASNIYDKIWENPSIPLKCLIKWDDYSMTGDMILTQMSLQTPAEANISHDALFEGSGALIIEENESSNKIN